MAGIAVAGHGLLRHRRVDRRQFVRAQPDRQRAQCFCKPVTAAGADHRHDILATSQHPGDGELRHRDAARLGDGRQRPHQFGVLLQIVGDNLKKNTELVRALAAIAQARGITVAQLAIAWVLGRGQDIVPVIGARRRDRLTETLGALTVRLGPDELAAIDAAVAQQAVAGDRYASHQMAMLDSEKG